jgi:hypothetical protein
MDDHCPVLDTVEFNAREKCRNCAIQQRNRNAAYEHKIAMLKNVLGNRIEELEAEMRR